LVSFYGTLEVEKNIMLASLLVKASKNLKISHLHTPGLKKDCTLAVLLSNLRDHRLKLDENKKKSINQRSNIQI